MLWDSALPTLPGGAALAEAAGARLKGQSRRALVKYAHTMNKQPWNLQAGLGYAATALEVGVWVEAHQVALAMNRRRSGAAIWAALAELSVDLVGSKGTWKRPSTTVSLGPAGNHAAVLTVVAALRWGSTGVLGELGNLGGAPRGSLDLGYPEQHAHVYRLVRLISAVASRRGARLAWQAMREALASGAVAEVADYLAVLAATDFAQGSSQRALVFGREARRRSIVAGDRRGVYVSLAQASDASVDRTEFPPVCSALEGTSALLTVDCRLQLLASRWGDGQLEPALNAYEQLVGDARQEGSPILAARFAEVAVPLLRFLGRWSELEEVLDRGTRAAKLLGRHEVATRLELSKVSALRASGRGSEAAKLLDAVDERGSPSAELETRIWLERARLAATSVRRTDVVGHLLQARARAATASDSARALVALTSLEIAGADQVEWDLESLNLGSSSPLSGAPSALAQSAIDAVVSENLGNTELARHAYDRAEAALATWISHVNDLPTRLSALAAWEGLGRRRARLELDAGMWAAGLEALDRSRSSLRDEQPVRLAHLQTHLSDDEALLAFRFLGDEVWAWRVGPTDVRASRLSAPSVEVHDAAELWIESVSTARPNQAWQRLGSRLAQLTMHQIEAAGWLDGLQTLIVLPGGGLESLPLDSLPVRSPGEGFYGDRIVFARSRSISDLDRAMHRKPRGGLAVAFIPSGGGAIIPEVEGVLSRGSSRAFVGADATESAFVVHAPMSRLIHFGGHSVPPNGGADAGGLSLRASASHNGFLSFAEIAALNLDGATVVLLGCDTARTTAVGTAGRGGLPTSLADAFMVAGSRNVVGSLWPLNERTAGELGKLFYSAGGPESGAASLATAKRMLRKRHPDEPFRWAGAVWQGAPGGAEQAY